MNVDGGMGNVEMIGKFSFFSFFMNDTNTNIFQTWCEFFMHQSQLL